MSSEKPGAAPRAAALAIFAAVYDKRRPLDEAFAAGSVGLDARDRALVRATVTTALKRLGQIDALIAAYLDRKLPAGGRVVQHVLRLALAELLFLDHAAHAVVDSAVDLAAARGPKFKALVNAILRRAQREGAKRLARQDAARLNCPDWLWQRWSARWGEAAARADILAALDEPTLDLTVKHPAEAAQWAERLDATALPSGSLRRATAMIDRLPGFDQAAWWVQDAAAALPARLLGPVAGRHVIDLCAAPGGKTAQLLAAGAIVTAVERAAPRAQRLADNLARLDFTAEIVVGDAATWRPAQPADAVLLDAPCSATGTLRRHPDIAWNKSDGDVDKLAQAQARLLDAAAQMVKPGGVVVYATCSLEAEEGEDRIAAFLAGHPDFALSPIAAAEIGGTADALSPEGYLRTHPAQGWDGFFAARLVRKPA